MFSLGSTKEQLIAKDVCAKLTRVIGTEAHGKEIAIQSANEIIRELNEEHHEALAKAIKAELERCHDGMQWHFAAQ